MNMDLPNLDEFRANRDSRPKPKAGARRPRRRRSEWFLKGPIPGEWLGRAARLSGRALHVALAVWHQNALESRNVVKLTWGVLDRFGVTPDAGARGLAALERAGLVSVQRHRGRSPLVTIQGAESEG